MTPSRGTQRYLWWEVNKKNNSFRHFFRKSNQKAKNLNALLRLLLSHGPVLPGSSLPSLIAPHPPYGHLLLKKEKGSGIILFTAAPNFSLASAQGCFNVWLVLKI